MRRHLRSLTAPLLALVLTLAAVGTAVGHELDHIVPGFGPTTTLSTTFNSGGEGAAWDLVTTIVTGNPHTDLDFFTQGGDTYLAAGTLGTGVNAGGQTIVRLTEDGELAPSFVAGHPSAACLSDPLAMLGLQHDVEATPKGDVIYNVDWGDLVDRTADAQLLLDATDASGRCHDGGEVPIVGSAPQGGLEIIDITDPANPVEIGLTSHIGEAHTVNVDPSRPHIAYAVTSDRVAVNAAGERANETTATNTNLDGFEVVDLRSCLEAPFGDLAPGASVDEKRESCRPEVYRYRYEDVQMALGHTNKTQVHGCHELEVHPDDTLTCAGGDALLVFDISGMFDDNGTPDDRTDDRINGTPLPCSVRPSSSGPAFSTGAMVTDCVVGEDGQDLRVHSWLADGAPSVEGVEWLGSAHHQGREALVGSAVAPAFDADEDVDFNHEAEFTHSGRNIIVTDERGGGVAPGGASCSPGVDIPQGNGGLHAYAVDRLKGGGDPAGYQAPDTAEDAWESYALTAEGEKAIARAPINTGPQVTECTAHVFHQIPGQNRIFMGWYTQGVQVWDYVEGVDEDGNDTFDFHHVGYFIPELANTWTSAVWRVTENEDGTFTYDGASSDFNVGNGRSAIDLYRVTLPPPRQFAGEIEGEDPVDPTDPTDPTDPGEGDGDPGSSCDEDRPGKGQDNRPPHCDGAQPGCPGERPGHGKGNGPDRCDEPAPAAATSTSGGGDATASSQTQVLDLRDLGILARDGAAAPPRDLIASAIALTLAAALLTTRALLRRRRTVPA
ncbi:hypothetical protein [Nitriliruptor alkaliphilus]|uniref:hypothetical protein n=1 Tax=Nitriliruptor alkaliphilus TaxID=427918 RepID=UPI00069742B4|nr:hypothetical protein [Nitriliruptor alkaliphilus]